MSDLGKNTGTMLFRGGRIEPGQNDKPHRQLQRGFHQRAPGRRRPGRAGNDDRCLGWMRQPSLCGRFRSQQSPLKGVGNALLFKPFRPGIGYDFEEFGRVLPMLGKVGVFRQICQPTPVSPGAEMSLVQQSRQLVRGCKRRRWRNIHAGTLAIIGLHKRGQCSEPLGRRQCWGQIGY